MANSKSWTGTAGSTMNARMAMILVAGEVEPAVNVLKRLKDGLMQASEGWEDVFGRGLTDPGRDASRRRVRDRLAVQRRNSRERMRRRLVHDSRYGRKRKQKRRRDKRRLY